MEAIEGYNRIRRARVIEDRWCEINPSTHCLHFPIDNIETIYANLQSSKKFRSVVEGKEMVQFDRRYYYPTIDG